MIAVGKPHLLKTLVSCVIMILAVAVLMGMASDYHVAKAMHVSIKLNFPVAVRKGPPRSIATLTNSIVTSFLVCISCLGLLLSILWHLSHFVI